MKKILMLVFLFISISNAQAESACGALTTPIHYLEAQHTANAQSKGSFLTPWIGEARWLQGKWGYTMKNQESFNVSVNPVEGLASIYRLDKQERSGFRDFIWVTKAEIDKYKARGYKQYEQKPVFYAFEKAVNCSTPVYRLSNDVDFEGLEMSQYAYGPKDLRKKTKSNNWKNNGIAFYAGPTRSSSPFVHPGVLLSKDRLNTVRKELKTNDMLRKEVGALKWTIKDFYEKSGHKLSAASDLSCRPWQTEGYCYNIQHASRMAYLQAMAWTLLKDTSEHQAALRYAQEATHLLTDWSDTLQTIQGGAFLNISWAAGNFAKAAELLRDSYPEWTPQRTQAVQKMFRKMYDQNMVLVNTESTNGANANAVITMIESMLSISVFNDDREIYAVAMKHMDTYMRNHIYWEQTPKIGVAGDPSPVVPRMPFVETETPHLNSQVNWSKSFWYAKKNYQRGLHQETCRDMSHLAMNFGAVAYFMETARIQGDNVWGKYEQLLIDSLKLNTDLIVKSLDYDGRSIFSKDVCFDRRTNTYLKRLKYGDTSNPYNPNAGHGWKASWNLMHQHLVKRRGNDIPELKKLLDRIGITAMRSSQHLNFERLWFGGSVLPE